MKGRQSSTITVLFISITHTQGGVHAAPHLSTQQLCGVGWAEHLTILGPFRLQS